MRFRYTLSLRLRSLFRRDRVERELDEELRDYIERRTEQEIAAGATPEDARRIAQRALGGIELRKEECRDARRTQWIEHFAQDLRYGWRSLRASPAFTSVALVSLALGIGANTAIFSVVNALLLRPLAARDPARLIHLRTGSSHTSYPNLAELREQSASLSGLAGHRHTGFSFTRGEAPIIIFGEVITPDYFSVLGIAPVRGRVFTADPADAQAAVVSDRFWQRFERSASLVGQEITLDGRRFTVAGIMPETFHGAWAWGMSPEVWVPVRETDRAQTFLELVGRLKSGVTARQAQAELTSIAARIPQGSPEADRMFSRVEVSSLSGIASFRGISSAPKVFAFLGFLAIVSGLVLAIACANVASLMLARATVRRREIATRLALGAGRGRVVRQLLTESALLSALGAVAGIAVAQSLPMLFPLVLQGLPVELRIDARPDWRVLGYMLAVSLASALVFGLKPALDATRGQTHEMLKGLAGGRRLFHLRGMLVVGQVAVCFALLVTGGLFVRTLGNVQAAEPGFDVDRGLTADLALPEERYTREEAMAFYGELLERTRSMPGVSSASLASIVPLSLNNTQFPIRRETGGPVVMVYANTVAPDYFRTLSIPLVRGRDFTVQDRNGAPGVALVNETLSRQLFPDGAIGVRVATRQRKWEIVGVVRDSKYLTLGEEPLPVLYTSFFQENWQSATLHVRAAGAPGPLLTPVKRTIEQLDPWIAIDLRTMRQNLESGFGPARLGAAMLSGFGFAGLLLASVGVFGLVAYSVSRRSREIGIRMALGAQKGDVLRLVVGDGMILVIVGLGIGVGAASALTLAIRGYLVGVEPTDPVTFGVILSLLTAVALLACYLPARRSLNVDPSSTLRQD